MAKLPYMQFFVGDWRKDPGIQSLTFHDRGVWFEILCLMHESEQRGKLLLNGKAISPDVLARLLGMGKQQLLTTLDAISAAGVASLCPTTGALMNRRMVREENIRILRSECGKLGGNPLLLNQKDKPPLNQKDKQISVSDIEDDSDSEPPRKGFVRPTIDSLLLIFAKSGMPEVEAEKFFNYYESNGWKVGKNAMKSLNGAVANWKLRWEEAKQPAKSEPPWAIEKRLLASLADCDARLGRIHVPQGPIMEQERTEALRLRAPILDEKVQLQKQLSEIRKR